MMRAEPDEEDHVKGYGPETFGERMAGVYDTWVGSRLTEARTLESVKVLADLAAGGTVLELAIGTGRVALPLAARGLSVHDPVAQTVQYQYIVITQDGARLYPVPMRYAWPSELDLMARLAGLVLRERWGGWDRSPFTASSSGHVSVYARAEPQT